jgi:site-specific recombinase XerD
MPGVPSRRSGIAPPALTDVLTSAAAYASAEKAAATRLAYRGDWRDFETWCNAMQVASLPATPAAVAGYLAHLADTGRKASTIARRLAAIAYAHKLKGLDAPTSGEAVRAVHRGIRRKIGVAQAKKAPATAAAIAAMVAGVEDTLAGKRDRALLLVGFAAALRRSEIVDLKVNSLEPHADGILLHLGRSKTDQEGAGCIVPVPRGEQLRPVEALEAWLAAARITDGPVFRPIDRHGHVGTGSLTDRSVADIVKRRAREAGLDAKMFSGHSLRAGFVTEALERGADILKVMDITRHRRLETLKGYDRRAKAFKNHAGREFL